MGKNQSLSQKATVKKVAPPYRIVFMGTPQFALYALMALFEEEKKGFLDVCAVVTQPDKPRGRGRKITYSPVKEYALSINKPIFQPVKLSEQGFIEAIEGFKPHFYVVAAYGKILPQRILDIPEVMPINIHGSLLPKYRGAAPIQWALLNGDSETGITIMKMDAGMDTGPMILQEKLEISPDETCGSLFEKMGKLGAKLIVETFHLYSEGKLTLTPQPEEGVTYAPPLKDDFNQINWNDSAIKISNLIRASDPEPGAYSFIKGERINFYKPKNILPKNLYGNSFPPGSVVKVDDTLIISTGDSLIEIGEVQKQGKRRMSAVEFLRGARLNIGDKFGN